MKEPDPEFYWLFVHVERPDLFDQPLPKDLRLLKLLYKAEKAQEAQNRRSGYMSEGSSESPSPKKYSFMKKNS